MGETNETVFVPVNWPKASLAILLRQMFYAYWKQIVIHFL